MSFGIRLSLAFLLLLSTCFVYYAFKMDLTTGKYDIHTPLMKRAYNDSDADWVRNLLARKLPRQRPSHGTSSSHSPKCRDDGIVTRAWEKKGAQIEYGQTKDVYDITVTVGGEAAVIRFFPVIEKLEPKAKRIAELEHHVAAKQFIAWGREYIHKLDMEVWYVVEKKMGSAAEVWGKELKADIHSLQEEAREFYKSKRKLSLSPE
ncbi:hypothetical protein APHAL10511_001421 [Amanita phalloides]|nr:hypothetical protein APHAL10511_001421 [Amanita phalloides]